MATDAELDRLVATYQRALSRLAAGNESSIESSWKLLDSLDPASVDGWLARTAETTGSARRAAADLASRFFDRYVAVATGAAQLDPLDIETAVARVRGGASASELWAEPIRRARMLAALDDIDAALNGTAAEVGQLADQDVTLAAREGTVAANQRHGIERFRRHPEPGACSFCLTAASNRYHSPGLRPIHAHCHCVTVPDLSER